MEQARSNHFESTLMQEFISDLAGFGPRRAGSPAGHKAEEYLIQKFTSFGLSNVHQEPITVVHRETIQCSVEVETGDRFKSFNVQPVPYCAYTPDDGIEGTLMFVDPGKLPGAGEWKGKIILTDICFPLLDVKLIARFSLGQYDPEGNMMDIRHPATWVRLNWHIYKKAVKYGAAGFIGILKDQPGGSYRMYAPYGFREKDILDKPVPGFWVSKHDGPELKALAKKGNKRVKMVHAGTHSEETTSNIVGMVPGRKDESVIIHCHHDSPFKSPVEDASGCSVVLALAKYFAERKDNERTLIFLLTAGHFYGSIGTRTFIHEHANDIVPKLALEITVEHIAKEAIENEQGNLVATGQPEGTGIFVPFNQIMVDAVMDAVKKNHMDRVFLLPPEGPLGDYPPTDGGDWYEAGKPVVNIISNPVYLLNAEDDLEWVMESRLPRVAGAIADLFYSTEKFSMEEIAQTQFKGLRLKMKLIRKLVQMKTTRFGTRPVY